MISLHPLPFLCDFSSGIEKCAPEQNTTWAWRSARQTAGDDSCKSLTWRRRQMWKPWRNLEILGVPCSKCSKRKEWTSTTPGLILRRTHHEAITHRGLPLYGPIYKSLTTSLTEVTALRIKLPWGAGGWGGRVLIGDRWEPLTWWWLRIECLCPHNMHMWKPYPLAPTQCIRKWGLWKVIRIRL